MIIAVWAAKSKAEDLTLALLRESADGAFAPIERFGQFAHVDAFGNAPDIQALMAKARQQRETAETRFGEINGPALLGM